MARDRKEDKRPEPEPTAPAAPATEQPQKSPVYVLLWVGVPMVLMIIAGIVCNR